MTDLTFLNDLKRCLGGEPVLGQHLYADHKGVRKSYVNGREIIEPMSGAKLWEKLADDEPTYPISRSDTQLLLSHLDEIADCLPRDLVMIDLAPGGTKSVLRSMQIGQALHIQQYSPKDVSQKFVETAVRIAEQKFPNHVVAPMVGDIYAGIGDNQIVKPTLAYFGGGTISNLVHPISKKFPAELLREALQKLFTYAPAGWLLLSFDTTNDKNALSERYGSKTYHDLICNVMHRAEVEFPFLGIKGDQFVSTPRFIEESHQWAHILTATSSQNTAFGNINKGDEIHITNSYKFTPELFEKEVNAIGYSVDYSVTDKQSGMTNYLLSNSMASSLFDASHSRTLLHLRVG